MTKLKLQRVYSGFRESIGLLFNDYPFLVTLEKPWLNNQQLVSCIPTGIYRCMRWNSPHFGDVFQVMNVPDRSNVLIHWGNYVKDTDGCILVGKSFGDIDRDGIMDIEASKDAFDILMSYLKSENEFELEIV